MNGSTAAGVSRRQFLRTAGAGTLGALGAAALTGCGTPFSSGMVGTGAPKADLSYWNLLGGGDGVRMVAMEDAYRKQYPRVALRPVTLSWGNPYYTKVALATLGNQPPDVAIAHLTRATILAKAGLLEPLDENELARYGLTGDSFTPVAWQKAHTDGKLYAIPLDTHPFVLYYNTDICKKAGLLDGSGQLKSLDGPDALAEALTAAQKVTGGYGGVTSVINDTATPWRLFSTLYWQLGGSVLADEGRKIVLDDAKAERVLGYLADLTTTRKVLPTAVDYPGAQTMFASGKAGFYFEGDWEVTTFLTSKTPFSMTRFPNVFGGNYACQADSHSFVLPHDGNRTAAKRKIIFEFVRSLLDQSATWAAGGHIPAWLPFQRSAAYDKIKPQSSYKDVADSVHYDDPAWYSGSGSDFENVTGFAIAAVLAGQVRPAAAVAQMRDGLQKYADTPSPV